MIKQLIKGSEKRAVKYHGEVNFLIFECNFCHKSFSKMESYARKQVRIHRNACCFCSPACRTKFFAKSLPRGPMAKEQVGPSPVIHAQATPTDTVVVQELHKSEKGLKGFLGKLFGG